MYESWFGMNYRPFLAAPAKNAYFAAADISNALHAIARCIQRSAGPALCVGSTGTGKTTLALQVKQQHEGRLSAIMLDGNSCLSRKNFLQTALAACELPYQDDDEGTLRIALQNHLRKQVNGIMLIADNADGMQPEILEELSGLSSLTTESGWSVQLILIGKPQLEERLGLPQLSSLNQQIAARAYLNSWNRNEVVEYVDFQIEQTGIDPKSVLERDALRTIHERTDGVPRLVNQLCDFALSMAAETQQLTVNPDLVEAAWAELQQIPLPVSTSPKSTPDDGNEIIEFGSLDDGPVDDGPVDEGPVDDSSFETGSFETGSFETGSFDDGPVETGSFETGPVEDQTEMTDHDTSEFNETNAVETHSVEFDAVLNAEDSADHHRVHDGDEFDDPSMQDVTEFASQEADAATGDGAFLEPAVELAIEDEAADEPLVSPDIGAAGDEWSNPPSYSDDGSAEHENTQITRRSSDSPTSQDDDSDVGPNHRQPAASLGPLDQEILAANHAAAGLGGFVADYGHDSSSPGDDRQTDDGDLPSTVAQIDQLVCEAHAKLDHPTTSVNPFLEQFEDEEVVVGRPAGMRELTHLVTEQVATPEGRHLSQQLEIHELRALQPHGHQCDGGSCHGGCSNHGDRAPLSTDPTPNEHDSTDETDVGETDVAESDMDNLASDSSFDLRYILGDQAATHKSRRATDRSGERRRDHDQIDAESTVAPPSDGNHAPDDHHLPSSGAPVDRSDASPQAESGSTQERGRRRFGRLFSSLRDRE